MFPVQLPKKTELPQLCPRGVLSTAHTLGGISIVLCAFLSLFMGIYASSAKRTRPQNFVVWFFFCCSMRLQFSSVQSLNCVRFFATPWTAARQASLPITNYQSLFKFISVELVKTSNHLILCCPLLLPPSIFPSIGVFSSELGGILVPRLGLEPTPSAVKLPTPNHWTAREVPPAEL